MIVDRRIAVAACAPHPGAHLGRLEIFFEFLQQRLGADDYRQAEALFGAAISPHRIAAAEASVPPRAPAPSETARGEHDFKRAGGFGSSRKPAGSRRVRPDDWNRRVRR